MILFCGRWMWAGIKTLPTCEASGKFCAYDLKAAHDIALAEVLHLHGVDASEMDNARRAIDAFEMQGGINVLKDDAREVGIVEW